MTAVSAASPIPLTAADLADRFGPMPLSRFRFFPLPGAATERDVLEIHRRESRLCELVDGILVEKALGYRELVSAAALIELVRRLARGRGAVAGADGMMRLAPGLVRIPDVSFIPWDRFPNRRIPDDPIPDLAPDLGVEVIGAGNTKEEMRRKLLDYFSAGCRQIWFVDATARTVTVFSAADEGEVLTEEQTLDGGVVLPGFSLVLRDLFAELDPHD
jgi:Uma2 family endonuclease